MSLSDYNLASCLRLARESERGDHVHLLLTEADRRAALVGTAPWWPAQEERLLSIYWLRGPKMFLESLQTCGRQSFEPWPLDLLRTVVEAAPHAPPHLKEFALEQSLQIYRLLNGRFRGHDDGGPSSLLLASVRAGVASVVDEAFGDLSGWSWRALHELRDVAVNDPEIKESGFIQTIDEELARRSHHVPNPETAALAQRPRRRRTKVL